MTVAFRLPLVDVMPVDCDVAVQFDGVACARMRCFAARSTNNGMKSRIGFPSNSGRLSATARSTMTGETSGNVLMSLSTVS